MWCSIKIALFFFVIGANAAKRKATVRRADHITIGSIENPHQNLSDNVQLTLMQTTTNADGSIVSRWSQEYMGIHVWNGQIAKRESKNRTVYTVDECKGTKTLKHIQETVTTVSWFTFAKNHAVAETETERFFLTKVEILHTFCRMVGMCPILR